MFILTRSGVVISLAVALLPATAYAQAPRAIPLPQPAHAQPINIWQQYYLGQAILQQNALQQYAYQQLQFQNPLPYSSLPFQGNVLYAPPAVQQQETALLYTIQQLQQQNALLYGWIQQQALLQQIQQGGVGQNPPQQNIPH